MQGLRASVLGHVRHHFRQPQAPIRDFLLAVSIFVNGAKGHGALQLSRDLDVQYKTAFVLAHKLREAMAAEMKDMTVSGTVEVDGAYFGGHIRPANNVENALTGALPSARPASAALWSSCASAAA